MKYHAARVRAVVAKSGIDLVLDRDPQDAVKEGIRLNLPVADDLQSAKLMLALDIRRLAELIAVAEVWAEFYKDDEEKFNNIGINEFLDVMYRFRKHPREQWEPAKDTVDMANRHIGNAQRFQLKYPNANGQTNSQMRNAAGIVYDFIFNATSKILHADEYSVQNHVSDDPFAWFTILAAGHKVLQLYQANALAEDF
jgi:hypothetical protein